MTAHDLAALLAAPRLKRSATQAVEDNKLHTDAGSMLEPFHLASPAAVRIYRRHHLVGPTGITGLSAATLYRQISTGKFPAPVSIGDRAVGWPSDVIEQWLASRSARALRKEGAK